MKTRSMNLLVCMMLTIALAVMWLLGGCTAIREHPRLAAAAAGVVVTSIALSSGHGDHQPAPDIRLPIPPTRELAR